MNGRRPLPTVRSRVRAWTLAAFAVLALALVALTAVAPPAAAQDALDSNQYQLPMGRPATTAAEAMATLPDRRATVVAAMACGSELGFASEYRDRANGEDIAADVLGKLAWLQQNRRTATVVGGGPAACEFTTVVDHKRICEFFNADCRSSNAAKSNAAAAAFLGNSAWTEITDSSAASLREVLLLILPRGCADVGGAQQFSIAAAPRPDPAPGAAPRARLTFTIKPPCLAAEVDAALLQTARGDLTVGTDGGVCHYFGSTKGDWDATLKTLIRVAWLDRRVPVLGDDARRHLNDTLIDIDGGPAQERYHLWECGNEERSVGDPATRSDDRDGVDGLLDDVWDSGWDIGWLLLSLLVFFALIVWAGFLIFGFAAAAAIATGLAAAVVAALLVTIPETENHLWMINSTKYLNNQYILANGGTGYWSDQNALREWILKELQNVVTNDFTEYNSRPYQRYSLVSITNLADFAEDPDVRTAARAVLEASIAKYAVTSSEGRRVAPFRRKREDMPRVDGIPRDAGGRPTNGLFDLIQGSDHLHAVGLYYFGLAQNLPRFDDPTYGAEYAATTAGYAPAALYYATSGYLPDEATFALAIERRSAPLVHQRLHHRGYEVVSSGEGFTITAGGLTTGMAKNVVGDAVDKFLKRDDLGAAVPTTLMLAGPADLAPGLQAPAVPRPTSARRSTLGRFLRFDGKRPDADDKWPSYDRNLCVWDGFACGVNVVIPDDLKAPCMQSGGRRGWHFIRTDAKECAAYATGPAVWVALYYLSGPAVDVSDWGSVDSFGFLEAVDAAEMTFDDFKARVLARNPGPDEPMHLSGGCGGTYVSARGQQIAFSCERVTKVDATEQPEPEDWGRAGAPPGALGFAPIQATGEGRLEISSPVAKRKVVLNLERWYDPRFDAVAWP